MDANIYALKNHTQKHLKHNTGVHYSQFNHNIQMQVGAEYYLFTTFAKKYVLCITQTL